jgi:tRNA A37 threonylcarbamoyladenosine dehydratase
MEDRFDRTRLLLGDEGILRLSRSTVVVAGLGGVGSYAVEALVRAGVGRLVLIDHDVVSLTNLNRQLIATCATLGRDKVQAARERVLDINPHCQVSAHRQFLDSDSIPQLVCEQADFVVDAIDSVRSKAGLAVYCISKRIRLISCMGTGNRLDPMRFRIADVSETRVCPLARAYRQELRKAGIVSGVTVVFSDEPPVKTGCRTPGSTSFVPPAAGLAMAGYVIRTLAGAGQ